MAFEEGHNMFTYTQEIFRNYKNDRLIFMKALQTVQYFQTRPDYPYSLEELDKAISRILGQSLTDMSYGAYKYAMMDNPRIEWNPEDITDSEGESISLISDIEKEDANILVNIFKNEFFSFCYSLSSVFDKIFLMQDSPMKLSKLIITEHLLPKGSTMRLIRNDGETLDLSVDENDINFIISTLRDIKDE